LKKNRPFINERKASILEEEKITKKSAKKKRGQCGPL
jgi:hypothetical protein